MSFYIYNHDKLQKYNLSLFTNIIYSNFQELSHFPQLKHTRNDIHKLFKSEKTIVCLYIVNKKIGAYMVGEFMKLADGRNVFYISYIYTSPQLRNMGIASKMMQIIFDFKKEYNIDGIMLTCDIHDKLVYNFYLKKGFMPDIMLRNYSQHEILYK